MTEPDHYHKRGYLLPPGCKDISDAIKRQQQSKPPRAPKLPPITGKVKLPAKVAVRFVIEVSGEPIWKIIPLMRQLHIKFELNRSIDFEDAQRILRHCGIWAERDGTS